MRKTQIAKIPPLDIPYHSFQLRRKRGELGPAALNSTNQRLYALPSHIVQREAYAADREGFTDSYQGDPKLLGKQK